MWTCLTILDSLPTAVYYAHNLIMHYSCTKLRIRQIDKPLKHWNQIHIIEHGNITYSNIHSNSTGYAYWDSQCMHVLCICACHNFLDCCWDVCLISRTKILGNWKFSSFNLSSCITPCTTVLAMTSQLHSIVYKLMKASCMCLFCSSVAALFQFKIWDISVYISPQTICAFYWFPNRFRVTRGWVTRNRRL